MQLKQHLAATSKSIKTAAAETGYSVMAFRHWLSGRSLPRHSTMLRLQTWSNGSVTPADWFAPSPQEAGPKRSAATCCVQEGMIIVSDGTDRYDSAASEVPSHVPAISTDCALYASDEAHVASTAGQNKTYSQSSTQRKAR